MEVLMRRSMTWFAAALSFAVACSGDSVSVGTRSDGVIVYCNIGEYYYVCTPEFPEEGNPPSGEGDGGETGSGSDDGGGSGGTGTCGFDTYPCPEGGGDGSTWTRTQCRFAATRAAISASARATTRTRARRGAGADMRPG